MSENEKFVENRSEILFLYDVKDANPNGDPLDDNKPRMDEETEINLVTDVRLKRTVRDYIIDYKNQNIFIKDVRGPENYLYTAKKAAEDYAPIENQENQEEKYIKYESVEQFRESFITNILNECIDVRLFGATIPTDKIKYSSDGTSITEKSIGAISLAGPIQVRTGRSLHKVDLTFIKGTGAFAANDKSMQSTFREEYVLPYSLIAFYGVINENAAKDTKLTKEDLNLLFEGMWFGTKNLISRSKFGQMPRFLLQIEYKEKNYFIGDLNHKISLNGVDNEKSLRKISECQIDASKLLDAIVTNKEKISKISYKVDEDVVFKDGNSFKSLLESKFGENDFFFFLLDENSFEWDCCLSFEATEN